MSKSISQLMEYGKKALKENAVLETGLLLSYVLGCDRIKLITYPEFIVTPVQEAAFIELINRRLQQEPIAYIFGYKEFWSQNFRVTPATLIPRPETEKLIEVVLSKLDDTPLMVADIGTGSGVIACILALERKHWQFVATDISSDALEIARFNAKALNVLNRIEFIHTPETQGCPPKTFDLIVSNPPYIAKNDHHLQQGDLIHEPITALVSGEKGLDCFNAIIQNAKQTLKAGGLLTFEHGFSQGEDLRTMLSSNGYESIETFCDNAGNERVTIGEKYGSNDPFAR